MGYEEKDGIEAVFEDTEDCCEDKGYEQADVSEQGYGSSTLLRHHRPGQQEVLLPSIPELDRGGDDLTLPTV